VCDRARRGASGALLPAIRYSGVEFLPEVWSLEESTTAGGVDSRALRNVRRANPVRSGRKQR
jgi:hypothetical protein